VVTCLRGTIFNINIRVVGSRPSMQLRSSMIAVTLITSARLGVSKKFASDRSLDSDRNVEPAPKKLPSFLDIPEENDEA